MAKKSLTTPYFWDSCPATPIQTLQHSRFSTAGVEVFVKREDLNHPLVQGNKWHKLAPHLHQAWYKNSPFIASFGGAHSNHLLALAAAAQALGIPSVGFVRGDELMHQPHLYSARLQKMQQLGMKLQFLSRQDYRLKTQSSAALAWQSQHPQTLWIAEGGSDMAAVQSVQHWAADFLANENFDHIYTGVGTGGTLAGIILAATAHTFIHGIAASHQVDEVILQVKGWIGHCPTPWELRPSSPGFGKVSLAQSNLSAQYLEDFQLRWDEVYQPKMIAAFEDDLAKGKIVPGSRVLLIHTGGIFDLA